MMSAQNGKVVFDGKSDVFNGVTVDSQVETCQVDLFANKLKGAELNYLFKPLLYHSTVTNCRITREMEC